LHACQVDAVYKIFWGLGAASYRSKKELSPQISAPVIASFSTDIEPDLTCSNSLNPRMKWEKKANKIRKHGGSGPEAMLSPTAWFLPGPVCMRGAARGISLVFPT
jgi:hypothetical protein